MRGDGFPNSDYPLHVTPIAAVMATAQNDSQDIVEPHQAETAEAGERKAESPLPSPNVKREPRMERQAALALCFCSAVLAVYQASHWYAQGVTDQACTGIFQAINRQKKQPQAILDWEKIKANPKVDDGTKMRLGEQYQALQEWTQCRMGLTLYYLNQYYAAIATTTITTGIAAVTLIYITKASLSSTWLKKPWIITLFFTASAAAVCYKSLPDLFRQKENMTANNTAFIQAMMLSNQIKTYVATGLAPGAPGDAAASTATKTEAGQFIVMVDQQMKEIFNLVPDFDPTKQPQFNNLSSTK